MPRPPGEETLSLIEFAGAGAAVDVMSLTSMHGLASRSFFLPSSAQGEEACWSWGGQAAAQAEIETETVQSP